jgi:hypothetical protein
MLLIRCCFDKVMLSCSACTVVDWLSFTSFRCTTAAFRSGLAVALPISATVGGQIGSASNLFSYSSPVYSLRSGVYTPGSRITIFGKNFGELSVPSRVLIGSSACSMPVMLLPHLSFSCVLPVPNSNEGDHSVLINIGGNEVTFNDSRIRYDTPNVQRSRGHSHTVSSGSSSITLIGNLFGDSSISPNVQLGSTMSPASLWRSSSSVRAKVPSGFGCSLPGIVSFYRGARGSISMAFSYRPQIVAATTKTAYATSGSSSITILGSGLGVRRFPGSVSAKLGSSSCSSSHWSSYSHIACKLNPGSGHIYQVVSSAPGSPSCSILTGNVLYPHTLSYDPPSISVVIGINNSLLSTGSTQIFAHGASFSRFDTCIMVRLGTSAAVTTRWSSQSALLCKFPASRGGSNALVTASTPSQVPAAALGYHAISGVVRSVLSGDPVPGTKVSLLLDGRALASVTPDSMGYFHFSNLINADHVVVTEVPSFAPLLATVSSAMPSQNYTAAPGPSLQTRQYRIVLTWSTFPNDLDVHLVLPDGCKVYVFAFNPSFICIQISFFHQLPWHFLIRVRRFSGNMECSNTWLNRDIVDGWGPESISLTSPIPGSYSYSVSAPCQSSIVRSAYWHTLNVTNVVRDLVLGVCAQGANTLQFSGNYNSLFGNPAPGIVKTLKIVFADGSEWSGIEGLASAVQLPQLDLSKSLFTVTFYGATSEPLVFVPDDLFMGNTIIVFNFSFSDSGVVKITHVSNSIKAYQDKASTSARMTPSVSRNLLSDSFLLSGIPSRIAIHSLNASTMLTSGSVSLTVIGRQFGLLATSIAMRLSASSAESSMWFSDTLVSCKSASTSRSFYSIQVSSDSRVALSNSEIGIRMATASSLRYTSGFAFRNHEVSSFLFGQNFGTSPSDFEQSPMVLHVNDVVCSSSKWISDSSILCQSSLSPFQSSYANVTVLISSTITMLPRSLVPINVQYRNVPAICNMGYDTTSASYGLAPVILKSCQGRTSVIDQRISVVPVFSSLFQPSNQHKNHVMVRFVRFQGRSAHGGLQISYVSVMSADGVNLSQNERVSSSGSINSSSLSHVVNGPSEARAFPGIWEGISGQDWLEIDLGREYPVSYVVYYNRLDCCQFRAENALLSLMDTSRTVVEMATLTSELVQVFNFSSSCSQSEMKSLSCSCGTGFSEIGLRLIDVELCSMSPGVHVFNSSRSCSVYDSSTHQFTCSCNGHPGNMNTYRIACSCSPDGLFSCSCAGSSAWSEAEFNTCNMHSIHQRLPGLDLCSSSSHNCSSSGGLCLMSGLDAFNCSCKSGFRGDGYSCIDIDECSENIHNCSNGAHCKNTPGGFLCVVDFCAVGNNCSAMASCSNSLSSFSCTCNPGFQGDGHVCTDIDECSSKVHSCWAPSASFIQTQDPVESCKYGAVGNIDCLKTSESAVCTNTIGSYTCQCPAGFSGDGKSCQDVDECQLGLSNCSSPHSNAFCINTIGSFQCQCKPGYTGALTLKTCPEGAIRLYTEAECTALQGIFYQNGECLKPPPGGSFSYDNRPQCLACSDINECLTGDNACPSNSFCSNLVGSYRCICKEGYSGDGQTCWDIDECATNTHNCSASQKCVNTIGSFVCQCTGADCFGFGGDCELNPNMCGPNGICNTTEFGTVCSCRNGYSQMQGQSGSKCAGVHDPLCWTHAATMVKTPSVTSNILSATSISMSDDSRYALAAQSSGYVYLSVLPLSQIRVLSELSAHAVSLYLNGELSEFTTSQATLMKFLNPNVRNVLAIETVFFNSFAVIVDALPCRASQWRCTVADTLPSEWKLPDFDDSRWPVGTPTSFIAASSGISSLSDIHRSSQWVGLTSGSVSVSESVLKRVSSPKVAVYDDFQNNTLNTNFWTHVPSAGASYQVGAGSLVLARKAIIRSTSQFDFSLYPITVSGSFKFDTSLDFFQIYTRSDARPFDSNGEVNGLRFFFGTGNWPDGQASEFIIDEQGIQQPNPLYVSPSNRLTMSISMRVSDTQYIGMIARKNQSHWRALVGITYKFRIVDSGSFAQVFIDDTLQLTLTNIGHSSMLGGHIAFFNKADTDFNPSRLSLGPISIIVNAAASESRLFCRSATSVFRGGRTFTAIGSLAVASWVDVAVSASGLVQIAAATNRLLQLSVDGGITWGSVTFPYSFSTNLNWGCVSISGDGTVIVAATRFSFIFVSRNGIWIQSRSVAAWKSVAVSHDGSRVVAAADNNGGIFFTTNFGKSWNQNTGIRYLGKDWTSVSISSDGLSIIAASNVAGEVKEVISQFFYDFVVLNSTCQFFSPTYNAQHLSGTSPNFVQQYDLYDTNPAPSLGIDTFLIKFSCAKVSGSVVHGIVTSLAESEPERRLFCSSDVSGESWTNPDFDDSAWQLPSVVNLSSVTASAANPNASHIARFWIKDKPSYIRSDAQILWAPDPSASSFSCRYKLPAYQLSNRDWVGSSSGRDPNSPSPSLISALWRNATTSDRGTTWSAPTPLGYTTSSPLACNGGNVGSDLYKAQLACERCIECHSIERVGTNPGVFSLRRGTNMISYFLQVTRNEFWNHGYYSHAPTSYPYSVSENNYQSNVWFLGRQVGVAESHDFGRTWIARSSQRTWSSAHISADGDVILACSSGRLMKTRSFNHIKVSLSFSTIPSNLPGMFNFSVSGSVFRGVGVVSQHSGTVAANSFIFIPHADLNSFTVMFWLQTSSLCAASTWQSGCSVLRASAPSRSFSIHIASGMLFFAVGAPFVAIKSSFTVNDGKWHFIAASWNASTGGMGLYIDGELDNVGDSSVRDNRAILYAHTMQLGGSPMFTVSFDDFRVFSTVYEFNTIQNVFNRSTQLSMPYGASTKSSFNPIDDDLLDSAAGSCLDEANSLAISRDGSHIIAVLQSAASSPSIFDFNANRRLEPSDCIDVDECTLGTHTCSSNQSCFNTQGSFACNCSSGFTRVGAQCIDVNECAISAPCGSSQDCINTIGSFACVCKKGYGNVGCTDINECGATIFPCPFKSICTNTIGSFTCACPSGTELSGSSCVDVDECATGAHNCANSSCVNTFGSYMCVCSVCLSTVRGTITSIFTGLRVSSAEVYVLSYGSSELVSSTITMPSDNGTFALTVPMSASSGIQYRLLVKSFYNAELVLPFTVAANQEVTIVHVSVFQYCESLLGESASNEYSGCINVDPNMFIAVPSSISISKTIMLFGSEFPLMLCEARLGINITSDPDSYVVAQTCTVTSSMTVRVLAHNNTESFAPLQIQLIFRSSAESIALKVLTSDFGIVTLLNGTAVMQSVAPVTG